jgi:hypothetical protein
MHRRRLQVIEPYEVLGEPRVTATGVAYRSIVELVTEPYRATRLPVGRPTGLAQALAMAQVVSPDEPTAAEAVAG